MWFFLLSLYLALLNVLDLVFNLIGLKIYGFTVVELGVFNAVWTLTYIFSARVANRLADKGLFKKMQTVSFTTLVFSSIVLFSALNTHNLILFYTAYCLHAVTVSYARISTFTSILEYFDSSKWKSVNRGFIKRILVIEGLVLLTLAFTGFKTLVSNIYYFLAILVISSLLAVKAIPQPTLMIERIMFSIEKNLMRMLTPIRATLSLGYQTIDLPDKLGVLRDAFIGGKIGVYAILACLIGLRISNEYMLTPLPYHMMASNYGVESILIVYGSAKLLAPILLGFTPSTVTNKGSLLTASTARLLASIALYYSINSLASTILFLSIIFLVNAVLDAILYSLYIEATHGYKTGYYMLVNELTGFTGSLTSGLIYVFLGVNAILALIVVTSIIFLSLLRRI